MAFFGVVGYIFKKIDVPLAPMILTIILGPLMEQSLRQSLEMSRGSFWIFIEHPIALGFILVALTFVLVSTFRIASKVRGADSEV
jgi:putative tricarboxylic transport membrane protein